MLSNEAVGLALADAAIAEAECVKEECNATVAAALLDKEAAETARAEVQEASRIAEERCVVFHHELYMNFEPRRTNHTMCGHL